VYLDGSAEGSSGLFFPVCYLAEMWTYYVDKDSWIMMSMFDDDDYDEEEEDEDTSARKRYSILGEGFQFQNHAAMVEGGGVP